MILRNKAAQELKLKASTRANTSDEEAQGISSRKRARETADPDPDPENVHHSRKPRTTKEDGAATVVINSDSSYQAPGTEGVTTGNISLLAAEILLTFL